MVERLLADAANADSLRSLALGYTNAAGASADATIANRIVRAKRVPNALRAVLGTGSGPRRAATTNEARRHLRE